eukprot:scaffold2783_cov20-Tisochrysis_lutea.AAC.2
MRCLKGRTISGSLADPGWSLKHQQLPSQPDGYACPACLLMLRLPRLLAHATLALLACSCNACSCNACSCYACLACLLAHAMPLPCTWMISRRSLNLAACFHPCHVHAAC